MSEKDAKPRSYNERVTLPPRRIVQFFPCKTKMIIGYTLDDRGDLWELQCDVNDEDGNEPNVYKWTRVPPLPGDEDGKV